jgi:hypothetical protein
MNLSANFTLSELIKSSTAKSKGIDNTPTDEHIANLRALCIYILQPLREAYGKAINITSGYRSEALNTAIKGSKTSDHRFGRAADIKGSNKTENKKLFKLVQELDLPFDQLIDENNFQWVHVSYNPERNRKQVLKLTQ